MPKGNLVVRLTDLTGKPVRGVSLRFTRMSGEPGTGGETMTVSLAAPDPDLTVTGITCRGGVGTMYRVEATAPNYRPYTFLQLIQEDRDNTASDDVEFWVKPGDVTDISAPTFANLSPSVRRILNDATMVAERTEDEDLEGLSGAALYGAMGPLRKASLLNIAAKAGHVPTVGGNQLPSVQGLLLARQDRCFAYVKADWPESLRQNKRFTSAPGGLHDPLDGFQMTGESFKSRDPFGNLQVTVMRETATGELAADIDIDKFAGFRHGLEVIGNATLHNRTHPYAIRELLLATDPMGRTLKPEYEFRF